MDQLNQFGATCFIHLSVRLVMTLLTVSIVSISTKTQHIRPSCIQHLMRICIRKKVKYQIHALTSSIGAKFPIKPGATLLDIGQGLEKILVP